jgi:hypothetical protein
MMPMAQRQKRHARAAHYARYAAMRATRRCRCAARPVRSGAMRRSSAPDFLLHDYFFAAVIDFLCHFLSLHFHIAGYDFRAYYFADDYFDGFIISLAAADIFIA